MSTVQSQVIQSLDGLSDENTARYTIAIWAVLNDPKLPERAKSLILDEGNDIFYSTVGEKIVNNKCNACIKPCFK